MKLKQRRKNWLKGLLAKIDGDSRDLIFINFASFGLVFLAMSLIGWTLFFTNPRDGVETSKLKEAEMCLYVTLFGLAPIIISLFILQVCLWIWRAI